MTTQKKTAKKTAAPTSAPKEETVEPSELEVVEPEAPTIEDIREAELAEAEILADMPELRGPHTLRLRHRNRLTALMMRARDAGMFAEGSLKDDTESQIKFLDLLADMDEFAESIAIDKDAYAEWAEANAKNIDVFLAILSRYSAALGE